MTCLNLWVLHIHSVLYFTKIISPHEYKQLIIACYKYYVIYTLHTEYLQTQEDWLEELIFHLHSNSVFTFTMVPTIWPKMTVILTIGKETDIISAFKIFNLCLERKILRKWIIKNILFCKTNHVEDKLELFNLC